MFEITGTKSLDSNAIDFVENGINFVGRTFDRNGIQGKIEKRDFEPNEPYTITATVIGNYKYVKYQTEPYYCSQNINKLAHKPIISRWNKYIAYYFVANIQKFVEQYNNQQGGYKLEDIKGHIIYLPIKNGAIDFDLMEDIIFKLETERIKDVSKFLEEIRLEDCSLSKKEQKFFGNNKIDLKALDSKVQSVCWQDYSMGELFQRISTNKLFYKAKDLPNRAEDEFILPCLTSSFRNQGLNYYAPKANATILHHVISLPSNSDVYRAYYQPHDFTVLSDSYAIRWKMTDTVLTPAQYLFLVTCINKVTDLPIYSYKEKLGGWNTVKQKRIMLPVCNGEIDFEFMDMLIRVIEKYQIKDVTSYVNN